MNPWATCEEQNEREFLTNFYLWTEGYILCTIGGIGIIGNIFNIVIFRAKELKSTFHANLIVLAIFDFAYLFIIVSEEIMQLYDYSIQGTIYPDPQNRPNYLYVSLYPNILWPLSNILMTSSMYQTVVISLDRFVHVARGQSVDGRGCMAADVTCTACFG